jgi:hypothetical protein
VAAAGPNDISFNGRGGAHVTLIGSRPGNPAPAIAPRARCSGHDHRRKRSLASRRDLAAYETDANPAGGPIDSNPHGLLAEPAARVVADAGMNALLRVIPSGEISTLAVLPSRPARATDAVPTSVVVGPDGAYYVGELTGVPFAAGSARVYRVVLGEAPTIFATGFTTITDID